MQELSLHIDDHFTTLYVGRNLIAKLAEFRNRKLILLVDEQVQKLHGQKLKGLNQIIIPSGEKQKSLLFVEEVMRKLVDFEADRTSFLVGIGGGLVTDVAGFIAATFMRGIDFGFISSTLLGQVDASIGGKNGVNLDGYKNMIGVIRQPTFVWCDLDLINTLDQQELVSGYAEVIKYGAIKDRDLFEYIETNNELVLNRDPEVLETIVTKSASIKIGIVESDVMERGERKLLNFGHTLGHAIEKLTGILHGEAIAVGMVLAARLSVNLGYFEKSESLRLEQMIRSAGLPVAKDLDSELLFETLLKDKKRLGEKIDFILLKSLGEAFIHQMELKTLRTAINDLY
ncbi:MAG: 3-dehydroquinate synthase [Bacteroidales bacterium]